MRPYLWLLASRSLVGPEKAKVAPSDIVQQTLWDAHQKREQFRGDSREDLRAWLRAILINKVRNTYRDLRAARRDVRRELMLGSGFQLTAQSKSPSSHAAFDEEFSLMEAALAQLPKEHQLVIELRSFRRLPFAEVGQQINKSSEAARKIWFRSIKSLQAKMASLR